MNTKDFCRIKGQRALKSPFENRIFDGFRLDIESGNYGNLVSLFSHSYICCFARRQIVIALRKKKRLLLYQKNWKPDCRMLATDGFQ